jgi:tetratricopeptide (TPR) repeat protein
MLSSRTRSMVCVVSGTLMLAILLVPGFSRAQGTQNVGPTINPLTVQDSNQTQQEIEEKSLGDPKAVEAYNKFHKTTDLDKKIKLGNKFLNKYPNEGHAEMVYEELAEAYFAKRDLTNFYSIADQGIARFPNEPGLLAVTGTTMARAYNHDDPDAGKKLEKAEGYDQRAVDLLKTFKRPTTMTAQQFDAYKKQVSSTAHSGLGLIYFRKNDFANSVKELQLAAQDATAPDATDLLVLGADYENLNQFKDAADAFSRCAQIPGPMQAGCKQYADQLSKQAAQAK